MNFLQRLSNYIFGKPKIETATPAADTTTVQPAVQEKHIVTPMFIQPEEIKPASQIPVEFPSKDIKLEIKEAAPEATVTVSASTVEVAPEPKKPRAPAKKKSTSKKK